MPTPKNVTKHRILTGPNASMIEYKVHCKVCGTLVMITWNLWYGACNVLCKKCDKIYNLMVKA